MSVDLDKLNYYSGVNYMKRYISDVRNVGASSVNYTHSLGYVPQFVYYADLFGDGMLWYGGERVSEGTESTAGGLSMGLEILAWINTSTLTLYPRNHSSGSKEVHFVVYRDYGETQ